MPALVLTRGVWVIGCFQPASVNREHHNAYKSHFTRSNYRCQLIDKTKISQLRYDKVMTNQDDKVVIVGAGLAGLASGFFLAKRGYPVTILEARSRLGGRIDTRVFNDRVIEMGGEWIGSSHQRIKDLCRLFELKLTAQPQQTDLMMGGTYFRAGHWRFGYKLQATLKTEAEKFQRLRSTSQADLNSIDLWHFLISNHVPLEQIQRLNLAVRSNLGESIRNISTWEYLRNTLNHTNNQRHYRLANGNLELAQALADAITNLGGQIHLNTIVKRVHQSSQGVEVITNTANLNQEAKTAILTVPARTLASIHWYPALPEPQTAALERLAYSRITKTAFYYPRRFWPIGYTLLTDRLPQQLSHANLQSDGPGGILISTTSGDAAESFAALTPSQRAKEIQTCCQARFPAVTTPEEELSLDWSADPFAGGANASFQPDQGEEYRELLRAPHHRISFAGEHLAQNFPGFMEGAVESAEEAVRTTIKTMKSS